MAAVMDEREPADTLLDHDRELRTGQAEAIYGPGKTPAQVAEIATALAATPGGALFLTRASAEQAAAALAAVPGARWHERAAIVVLRTSEADGGAPLIAVVAAGTSDLPVADEAAITAEAMGLRTQRITDVGVAGVHRILAHRDDLRRADRVIVLAGM